MEINLYKNGTFSFERKLDTSITSKKYNEINVEQRKDFWEKLVKNKKFSLSKYFGISDSDVQVMLGEQQFTIIMNKELEEWQDLISCVKSNKYHEVNLPEFKWSNPETGELQENPPFILFFVPFLRYALGKMHDICNIEKMEDMLTENLEKDILNILVSHLYHICYRVLILELNICREENKLCGNNSKERMQDYSNNLLNDENYVEGLLQEYPVMYRLISIGIHNWLTNIKDILIHFKKDKSEIERKLFSGESIGEILKISGNMSDSHHGGKGVLQLEFEGGKKVIYKPRSLDLDLKFNNIIQWYNDKKPEHSLYKINMIDKDSYGWMEFINNDKCVNKEEIEHYYYKIGVLLCLLYVTRTTDIHYENIIACRSNPVIVDLEAMFHNRLQGSTVSGANGKIMNIIESSVRRVGILPRLSWGNGNKDGIDISALGGDADQIVPIDVPIIENYLSDEIKIGYGNGKLRKSNNRPIENKIDILEYKIYILNGFSEVYEILCDEEGRKQFLGIVKSIEGTEIRQILRATQEYAALLNIATHPDYMRSGLDREMLFTTLYKDVSFEPKMELVVKYEIAEMLGNDVPFFSCIPSDTKLMHELGQFESFFEKSCMELVFKKINDMGDEDYKIQKKFIDLSFIGKKDDIQKIINVRNFDSGEVLDIKQKCLSIAKSIGDKLLEDAIYSDDNMEVSWIITNVVGVKETDWSIEAAGLDLYNGLPGILLFLAQLYDVAKEKKYFYALQKGVNGLKRAIALDYEISKQQERNAVFGAYSGETSIICVLQIISKITKEDFSEEYQKIINMISRKIEDDVNYDMVSGSAGCIMQILNLYAEVQDDNLLTLAKRCGDHLLNSAEKKDAMLLWKPLSASNALAGYSHGASGIAIALIRLGTVLKDKIYIEAACKALIYERTLFVEEEGNWADIRLFEGESNFEHGIMPVAWCHGAPGVLLNRVQMLSYIDDNEQRNILEKELKIALNTTIFKGFGKGHCLCHGDMGNIDIMLYTYQHLKDEKIKAVIYSYLNTMISEFENIDFACGLPGQNNTPGFMLGLAGIGYELLRIYNEKIPSILAMDFSLEEEI